MEFVRSRLETETPRRDQRIVIALARLVGIASGLIPLYFESLQADFGVIDGLLSIASIIFWAFLGSYAIGLQNSQGLLGWLLLGMVLFGFPLRLTVLFPESVSWAAAFLVICCYHFWMNRNHERPEIA